MFALIPLIASSLLLHQLMFVYPEAPVSIEIIAIAVWSMSAAVLIDKAAHKIAEVIRGR